MLIYYILTSLTRTTFQFKKHMELALLIISFTAWVLIFLLLGMLAYTDARYYLLPNRQVAALALAASSFHIATHWQFVSPQEALTGLLTGGGFLLTLRMVANRFTKDDALGLGDVKFIGASGLLLGFPGIFLGLTLGAFIGLLHGMLMRQMSPSPKPKLATVNVPAGVGLAIGVGLVALYQFGFWWQK